MRKRQFYDRRSRSQADYGPLNGLSTDLVKLNSIGERRGKTPGSTLTIGEAGDVSIGDLHLMSAQDGNVTRRAK
jgi:hypothetical protein